MRYIEQWCDDAVSYIRFPPDRPAVRQELFEHMEEKYDEYVQEGMLLADAERRVIKEMGDYRETGLLLQKIHKPYLGWIWRVTQWLFAIALILAFIGLGGWIDSLNISDSAPLMGLRDPYETSSYVSESGNSRSERILYLEPNCSDSSDGYTFTVTKVAYWEGTYTDEVLGNRDTKGFYFLLEVTNPRPWAGYTDTPRFFHAIDSLGNHYYSCFEEDGSIDERQIRGNGSRTGLFTYTFHMWAENYCSQEAEWLELYYDRDGRDVRLRIDLTGGEGT